MNNEENTCPILTDLERNGTQRLSFYEGPLAGWDLIVRNNSGPTDGEQPRECPLVMALRLLQTGITHTPHPNGYFFSRRNPDFNCGICGRYLDVAVNGVVWGEILH